MKKVFLVLILIASIGYLYAQNNRIRERVEAQRVAFITQRLSLTPEEAQQFWPLYNQYTEKLQQIRNSIKREKPVGDMTDAEAEKVILNELDKESRELELRKEYFQKFKKVLSVKKIARLYNAERDFKAELLQRLKENKKEIKQMKRD